MRIPHDDTVARGAPGGALRPLLLAAALASVAPESARASAPDPSTDRVPSAEEFCGAVAPAVDRTDLPRTARAKAACLEAMTAESLSRAVASRDPGFCDRLNAALSHGASSGYLLACRSRFALLVGDPSACLGPPADARDEGNCLGDFAVRQKRLAVLDLFPGRNWPMFSGPTDFPGFTEDAQCQTRWEFFQCHCQTALALRGIPVTMAPDCQFDWDHRVATDRHRATEALLGRFYDDVGLTWSPGDRWGAEYVALFLPKGNAGGGALGLALGRPSLKEPRWYAELEAGFFLPILPPVVWSTTLGAGPTFDGGRYTGLQGTLAAGVGGLLGFARVDSPAGAGRTEVTWGVMLKVPGPYTFAGWGLYPAHVRAEDREFYRERERRQSRE